MVGRARDLPSHHERNETVTSDLTSQFVVNEGLSDRGTETSRRVLRLALDQSVTTAVCRGGNPARSCFAADKPLRH